MDFLQFPRQTLEYRSGDCDDLSILYCSLLESVGVETAFMTIPGHIFMAFALPMAPAQAARSFYRSGLFVEAEGKAWIPVEVTLVQAGFLNAWLRGAQGWYDAGKEARIYPVHAAWTVFEPVGLRLEEATLDFPTEAQVIDSYDRELSRLVSMELAPQEELLKAQLAANRSARNLNSAGTLYARFGRFETARQYFSEAAADGYKAAVINLGLLSFCQADYSAAKDWFMRALELDRSSSSALVGLARCYFELGDLVSASREYDRLAGLDPALAVKVSYLKAGAQMQEAVGRGSGIGGAQLPENWEE
jgi:tetratricopeptide (TPR) repeat protein